MRFHISLTFFNFDVLSNLFSDPLDLPITKREHFNRWYSTGAYYLALFISDVPVIITCCTLYIFLINVLTDQSMDTFRFSNFVFIGTLTSFTAQSFGMFIGSMFDVKVIMRLSKLCKTRMFPKSRCCSKCSFLFEITTLDSLDLMGSGGGNNCVLSRLINASLMFYRWNSIKVDFW